MIKKSYLNEIQKKITLIDHKKIVKAIGLIKDLNKKNKIILAGNGASSSISSHVAIDLTKKTGFRAINFNEANLITCFSNDFGYEKWVKKALEYYSLPGDILILISSSGRSKNIVEAAKICKKLNLKLFTLSGFSKKNPLSNKGIVNFHVDSINYNVIEAVHLIILLSIVESL